MGAAKKILVAVAFSRYTEGLIKYATNIAGIMNAEMVVASIINARDVEAVGTIAAMGYEVNGENYVAGIKAERQQELESILKKFAYPSEKVRIVFKVGNPIDELLKIAIKEDVDLIIMGLKGRSDLEHVLVGSVAEKVFRRSPIPILSYRDEHNAKRLRKRIDLS
jgi:nucleotide-binding universal stress UspA family protein